MTDSSGVWPLSPLRYPGSKRKLAPYLRAILDYNDVHPNVLVEPFVGGASVALHFLENDIVKRAIIADSDRLISSFWKVVFSKPDRLVKFVKSVRVNLGSFYSYKAVARSTDGASAEELAEACIFLNRTSFSGILTDKVGPLGGREQKSQYKISCRFNREAIIRRIQHVSQFKNRVTVLPCSWEYTIEWVETWLAKRKRLNKPLFYFDPPFFHKADQLYREYFSSEDHDKLCERILGLRHHWILSYDNAPKVRKMYSQDGRMPTHVRMPYSINPGGRRSEKELIITRLSLPPRAPVPKK